MQKKPYDFVESPITGYLGFAGLVGATWWLCVYGRHLYAFDGMLILLLSTSIPMVLFDTVILKLYRAPTAGLTRRGSFHLGRTLVKIIGLAAILSVIAFVYWLFPEYRKGFYDPFYDLVRKCSLAFLILTPIYIGFVDSRLQTPEDSLYLVGKTILQLRATKEQLFRIKRYLLGWIIKAFFLPLMVVYLYNDTRFFMERPWPKDFMGHFHWFYNFLFLTDLAFVSLGYALSLKLFNSHIRSSEPTFFGWFIALFCYQPFYSVFNAGYIDYQHIYWSNYFMDPVVQKVWGCLILLSIGIYSWSSVAFGLRFSNLTHRGIIRHGPYYFCKHPAYVTKLISFALVSIPFLVSDFATAFRSVLMLALLAGVYYYRAKTEEAHLSSIDETYLAYSNEVNGRWRKWLGWLTGKKSVN